MTLEEQRTRLYQLVATGEKHPDYDRVVAVGADCDTYVTHRGINKKIRQFKPRESKTQLTQREEITQSIIKPVVSSLRKPFYKVARNDKVIRKVDLKDDGQKQTVATLDAGFYSTTKGNKKGKSGLDTYLRTRFVQLAFIDPNSWIIAEWGEFAKGTLPKVNPFEVKAREAVNYEYVDGELIYLLVRKDIEFIAGNVKPTDKKKPKSKGYKWTIYGDMFTIVYTQADPEYLKNNPDTIPANGVVLLNTDDGHTYIEQVYPHKLGFVPAVRAGHEFDDITDSRTFVSPYDNAEPYFMKMIQAVSELDLTIALHTFPQKLQYIQKCSGPSREQPCHAGKLLDGAPCPTCAGTGFRFHKSAQDAIILPMPKEKEDMIDLDKLLTYKGPPIETVTFQKDYVDYLEVKSHGAVFNSTVFVMATIVKTATEKDMDMDSVHDTLFPFAAKISAVWEFFTSVFVKIAGADPAEVAIKHVYPGDLKLKTVTQLLSDLKMISDSGAPSFVKDIVSRDLAEQLYGGDQEEMLKFDTKHRFYPFNGKTPDEIMALLSMDFVPRFNKVLYGSFELIFTEIEKDTPNFWLLKFPKQWEIVGAKVNNIIKDLDKGMADRFTIPGANADTVNPTNPKQGADGTGGNDAGIGDQEASKTPVDAGKN